MDKWILILTKKNCVISNGCNKVVIEVRVVQFWSEIILVILNPTRAARSVFRLHLTQFNYHYNFVVCIFSCGLISYLIGRSWHNEHSKNNS